MALLIALSLFSLLMLAISYVGYRHYLRPARFYDQLGTVALPGRSGGSITVQAGEGTLVRIFRQIGEKVPVSPQDVTIARRYLIAAGFRSDSAVPVYYGTKIVSAVALLALALLFGGHLVSFPVLRWLMYAAAAAAGYWAPNIVLERLVDRRQERLRLALPDALDLMVVCVEAGLGLDQAMLNVSRELAPTHPEISEEMNLVTLEMQAGNRRADALRNLADRTGEPELRKLTAVLIQTDRFGTSMADALRTQSDFMRIHRRQQAEERAGKIGVKMVIAIFLFVLPAMFVITAGAGVLQLVRQLMPMLRH